MKAVVSSDEGTELVASGAFLSLYGFFNKKWQKLNRSLHIYRIIFSDVDCSYFLY